MIVVLYAAIALTLWVPFAVIVLREVCGRPYDRGRGVYLDVRTKYERVP